MKKEAYNKRLSLIGNFLKVVIMQESITLKLLEEFRLDEGEDLEFGRVIGNGHFSMAIKVDYPFLDNKVTDNIENPVMIITLEREKSKILENLLETKVVTFNYEKEREEARLEWLEGYDYETEKEANEDGVEFYWQEEAGQFSILPYMEYIEDNYGVNIFFMETCEDPELEEITYACELFDEKGFTDLSPDFFEDFTMGLSDEEIKEKLEKDMQCENITKIFLEKIKKIVSIIERDIRNISKTISGFNKRVSLDIHTEQFLRLNGKVFCTDPFVIL